MKKTNDFKRWDPIIVTWLDIHVSNHAHDPSDFIGAFKPCIRKTAGFFLAVSHGHLFICETDDRLAKTDFDCERINSFPLSILQHVEKMP